MRSSVAVTLLVLIGFPGAAPAQDPTPEPLGATLRGWAEEVWLQLLDRNGATGGRLSERGILERFHERIDDKYFLDRSVSAFSLSEDAEWYARDSGVRWQVASITKRDLVMDGEFKVTVPVSSKWAIGVRFHKIDFPEANRSPVRLAIRRKLSERVTGYVQAFMDPQKPGTDLEAVMDWRHPGGSRVELAVGVLDPMNDLVFLNFNAQRQVDVDTTLEYEKQPIVARGSITVPLGTSLRLEAYGGVMRPATILAYEGLDETAGLRQQERFAFTGGMLQWAPRASVVAGAFASTVWARSVRTPLSASAPVVSYRLTEQTTQLGVFGAVRVSRRWTGDFWLRHTWRPERRVFLLGEDSDVDFLLRSFNAQGLMTYTASSGFMADVGIAWNNAKNPRGAGQVPSDGTLDGIQYRLRYDLGYQKRNRFKVLVGSAMDLDGEGDGGTSFGGARGRFLLYW